MEPTTLGDALRRSCRQWPTKVAMWVPTGKEFEPISYGELETRVRGFCAVLRELGLQRGQRVCLQSENCVQWALLDWACQCLGVVLVPIYPTLPPDQTEYIARDCEAVLLVSSTPEQQQKVANLDVPKKLLDEIEARSKETSMDAADWEAEIDKAQPEDVATFVYTSGTTGNPKGAMLPHRGPLHVCKEVFGLLTHDDVFLTFLPMSHVFERIAGQMLPIYMGATIIYSKSLATLASDISTMKPTVLLCVPRFLEATMDKIVDGARRQPPLRAKLFEWAYQQGLARVDGKFAPFAGLLDKLVGEKIRGRLGGRLRYMVSGGAALPAHVARFYMAFNFTILQGYGLTETSAGTFLNRPERNKYWTVGPTLGMECKIAEDGEILVRGPGLFLGYYNLPEETAAAIDAEGWFHTGDVGEFEGDLLKITDRKKDILVLANGKNISPQAIENRLREDPLIQEVVLFGDGHEYVYGLAIPNMERVKQELGIDGDDEELVTRDDVRALMKQAFDRVNKGLADFEKVKRHALLAKPFTVESGELTPSLKVRRKVVREKYDSLLKGLAK